MHLVTKNILFIFEGDKAEKRLFESFERFYFNEDGYSTIVATFGTTVYPLYGELKNDEFLDVVEVLRERSNDNRESLEGIGREDIAEIYLFFDHDGHASNADDEKIESLLKYFNDETGQGKLYISYPMVEAVKHLSVSVDFQELTAEISQNSLYKRRVSDECDGAFKHLQDLDQACWYEINRQHFMKAWSLLTDRFELPSERVTQESVFNDQLEKHIRPNQSVAVLSAFPLLLLEYYGVSELPFLIGDEIDEL